MTISFDALPQDKPAGAVLDKGLYCAKIVGAEMKTPKTGGADYLALTYDLSRPDGTLAGKLWDNFFDIDKQLPRYKLQRLITALRLNLTGTFELKDLTKIVSGKELLVDVNIDEKSDPKRNQVDVFKDEIYYHVSELNTKLGVPEDNGDPFTPEPATVNAPDAADAAGTGTPATAAEY